MTKKERLKEILFEVNSGVSLLISDCVQKYGVSARSIQRDVKGLGLSYKEDIILKSQPVDTKKVVIDDNDNTKLPSGNSHGINSRLESHGVGSNPTSHNLHSSKNISHLSHTSSGTGQPISAPLELTPAIVEEAIVRALMSDPNVQIINAAQNFLKTKQQLNITNNEDAEICQSLKLMDTQQLTSLLMPKKGKSKENLPTEQSQSISS